MTAKRPCPEFETLLLDRAAGSLDGAEAARVETHLAGCEACRAEAAILEAALSAARLPPPTEAERRALDRAEAATLRHWRGAEGSRRNRSLMQGFAAGFAVAAAAAVLVIAPGAYRRGQVVAVPADASVPGNVALVPGNVEGKVEPVPGNEDSYAMAAGSNDAAAWEPDLDGAWELAALAVGETPGGENDLAWDDAAALADPTVR